jgi:hypothetical protein
MNSITTYIHSSLPVEAVSLDKDIQVLVVFYPMKRISSEIVTRFA